MKNFKEDLFYSGISKRYSLPKNTKSVTISSSVRIKLELRTKSDMVVGVGMVNDWSTSTLLVDEHCEADYIIISTPERYSHFSVYIHFNQ